MDIVRISSRRAGALFAAGLLLFATMLPALASAATVTNRSIALSSSVASATGVTYNLSFVAQTTTTGAFALDFCDSAEINTTCNAPSGLDTSGAGTSVSSHTVTDVDGDTVKVVLAAPVNAGQTVTVDITGIDNPDTAGVFYARIVTYTDGTTNYGYVSPTNLDTAGATPYLDTGGVAMSITDGFDVSGTVSETLTFCAAASGDTIGSGCTGTLNSPDITLGAGGILTTTESTGSVKTQISTNAAGGAVVSLKSDALDCGGLVRVGSADNATGCGIAPITTANTTSTISDALFGLKLGNLGGATGTTALESGGVGTYDTTNYFMNWVDGDATGVTSPYGDPIYNTGGDPVEDGTADLTFGAAISSVTPAGRYTASFSLIATGTF